MKFLLKKISFKYIIISLLITGSCNYLSDNSYLSRIEKKITNSNNYTYVKVFRKYEIAFYHVLSIFLKKEVPRSSWSNISLTFPKNAKDKLEIMKYYYKNHCEIVFFPIKTRLEKYDFILTVEKYDTFLSSYSKKKFIKYNYKNFNIFISTKILSKYTGKIKMMFLEKKGQNKFNIFLVPMKE